MGNTTLNPILYAKILGSSGGGATTPESVVTATSNMTPQQEADTLDNIGGEPKKFIITVTYDDVHDEYTADKTFAEILAAYNAGKTLVLTDGEDSYYTMIVGSDESFIFSYSEPGEFDPGKISAYAVDDSDYWEFYEMKVAHAPTTVTVSGTTTTIAASDNTIYECGELTSLTVSSFPASGKFWIWFTSGSTATNVSGIDNFTVEANKKYEIEVTNGYAKMWSWPTT